VGVGKGKKERKETGEPWSLTDFQTFRDSPVGGEVEEPRRLRK
jgi:hypothetical protein